MTSNNRNRATGLAWGGTAKTQPNATDETISGTSTSTTNASGIASIQLTDIMGERTVRVKASVVVGGQTIETNQPVPVIFGKRPLSELRIVTSGTGITEYSGVGRATWTNAAAVCSGMAASNFTNTDNASQSNLPPRSDLVVVSGGNGAYLAAGWPDLIYWTGEAYSPPYAFYVNVSDGSDVLAGVGVDALFVCRR